MPDDIAFNLEGKNINSVIHIMVLKSIKLFKNLSPTNWHSRASTISNRFENELHIQALEKKVTNRSSTIYA